MNSDPRPSPDRDGIRLTELSGPVGQVMTAADPVAPKTAGPVVRTRIENTSLWPVVITSHFHVFEANRHLRFDRGAAFGCHLDVPAGASVRFEPGETKDVDLVPYRGERAIFGFNGLTNAVLGTGAQLDAQRQQALRRLRAAGYLDTGPEPDGEV